MGKRKNNHRPLIDRLESRFHLSVSQDANGWTVVDPSADTHILYVSSSTGNDNNTGLSASSPVKTIAKGISLLRDGMPDWLLLKKGDTWHETFGVWTKSGRSPTEPLLVSSYGSGARPVLATGADSGIDTAGDANSVAFMGINFYANTRDPNSPDYTPGVDLNQAGFRWLAPTNSLLIEDCVFNYFGTNIMIQEYGGPIQNVVIRRNSVLNAYSIVAHSQGLYTYHIQGLRIEENLFDHNGWNENIVGAEATVFNHNLYLNSGSTNVVVKGNIIADASATGIKAGSGGDIQNNLFLRNPIGISYGTATEIEMAGTWGDISGNVFLDGGDIAGSPRSYAIAIGNTAAGKNTSIHDNIIAQDSLVTNPAIMIAPDKITRGVGVNDLTIANNIVYKWFAGFSVGEGFISGGIGGNALNNLTVRNNDFQQTLSPNIGDHAINFDPNEEQWSGNRYFSTSPQTNWFRLGPTYTATTWNSWHSTVDTSGTATKVTYADPDRNMASYNASLGGAATVDAFLAQVSLQSKQNWRAAYTSQTAIAYMKQGFSTYAVLVTPTTPLQTTETGSTATFQVVLSTQPTANVVVPISSSNTGEATVSTSLLTFTPANWNVPQIVTVTGVDDQLIDQDVTYNVVIAPAQSTDTNYNGLNAADLTLVNKALVPVIGLSGLALGLEASPYTLGLSALNMGTVTSWSINWGDGTIQPISGNPSSVTHTYADNGIYNITATATSSQGSAGNTKSLTISNVAPTLTITGAASANEAALYTLNLSSHDVAPDTISSWKITWGDGTVQNVTGNPSFITHTFADNGAYTISATATDEDGTYSANTKAVTINNIAPTLTVSGSGTVNQNSSYAINFTVSDPGADTVSAWNINWGDGQTSSLAGAARSAAHTYTVAGTFTITLMATDEDGSYSITGSVGVADTGGASISGSATSNEGALYTLNLSTTNASPLSWLIDWGDGAQQSFNGNPLAVTHIYADNGSYTITATLNAASGTYNTTKILSVANVAPALTLSGAASANEGSLFTLNLASSDVGTDTISSWKITWGDGAVQNVTGNPSFITHTFADNGVYTITATATDEDGTYNAAAGKAVTINNVAPVLNMSGNGTVNQGSPYAVGFSVTDPGADTVSSWSINWGDGQSSTLAGAARGANHSYANTGNFTITLTGTDEDGSYSITRGVKVVAATGGVSISGATTSNEGQDYTLLLSSGSASTVSWLVDWGDGSTGSTTGSSPSLTHTFADNGTFSIHATATIDGNTFSSNTLSLNVRNITPAISVSQNTDLSAGANQVLDLAASDPGLLDTVSWSINWGDGGTTSSTGLSSQVNHTYPSSTGNYVVAITATDKDGAIASATQYLILNNSGPAISLTGSASSPEGSSYDLAFSASGTGSSSISGWSINWGDGTTDNFAADATAASHLYADNGAYAVSVSASYDGGTSVAHKSLSVTNVAPTLTLGGNSVAEGSPFTLTLSPSDPGNDHIISWMINWGDGAQTPLAGTATSASHTYADNKIYNIVVTANDEDGYYSSVKAVTITNAAPTLLVAGASSIERGSVYTLSLTSADVGADAVSSWVIDWGDGNSENVTEGFANLTHVYDTEGQFTVNATATDEDGQWQANPLALNVTQQTHNLTPTIDLEATDLTESVDWYTFTVTLNYPNVSIVPDMNHVLVTGPDGFSADAELVTLIGQDGDSAFVATYRIAPADGHWDFEDNGMYTISLTAGSASSPSAATLGTFQSAVPIPDTSAPSAIASGLSITNTIGSTYTFTIHYADNSGAFMGDFDNTDLLVTGPAGYSSFATFVSVDLHNVATYSIVAPGGTWNAADNGTYSIELQQDAVHDAASNALTAGTIGNISVNIGDTAGNSLKAAKTLKLAKSAKITLSNYVGSADHDDYYKVTFAVDTTMSLGLSDAGSFSRLRVLNSKGRTLKSLNPGALTMNLKAGTYYVRLYSLNSADTVYKTKLVTKPTFSTTKIAA